jgi:hypothetical protein
VRRDGSLLRRYQSGEHEQVWREIRAHPRLEGGLRDEVHEVAEVTMRTVAQNADLIAARLRSLGWRAMKVAHEELRTPPQPGDEALLARVPAISGETVPPTLLAFWRVVGGINWVWDCDAPEPRPDLGFDLPPEEHDALCVFSPAAIPWLLAEWQEENGSVEAELRHPLRIHLAPDYLHKANFSGGDYRIELPFTGADPLFADERHELPFLDYLRLAFRWAGFPGLDRHAARRDVQDFVAHLGRDLLPF